MLTKKSTIIPFFLFMWKVRVVQYNVRGSLFMLAYYLWRKKRFLTRVVTAAEVLIFITGFQMTNNSIAPICNQLIRHYFMVIDKACIRKLRN